MIKALLVGKLFKRGGGAGILPVKRQGEKRKGSKTLVILKRGGNWKRGNGF